LFILPALTKSADEERR